MDDNGSWEPCGDTRVYRECWDCPNDCREEEEEIMSLNTVPGRSVNAPPVELLEGQAKRLGLELVHWQPHQYVRLFRVIMPYNGEKMTSHSMNATSPNRMGVAMVETVPWYCGHSIPVRLIAT